MYQLISSNYLKEKRKKKQKKRETALSFMSMLLVISLSSFIQDGFTFVTIIAGKRHSLFKNVNIRLISICSFLQLCLYLHLHLTFRTKREMRKGPFWKTVRLPFALFCHNALQIVPTSC